MVPKLKRGQLRDACWKCGRELSTFNLPINSSELGFTRQRISDCFSVCSSGLPHWILSAVLKPPIQLPTLPPTRRADISSVGGSVLARSRVMIRNKFKSWFNSCPRSKSLAWSNQLKIIALVCICFLFTRTKILLRVSSNYPNKRTSIAL